jgi:glucan 1,3-beta-glucosidase
LTVGNEYILNSDAAGTTTSSAYTTAVSYLSNKISTFNETILALNLGKHLPIGTSDAGSMFSATLATEVDYFMANVHP